MQTQHKHTYFVAHAFGLPWTPGLANNGRTQKQTQLIHANTRHTCNNCRETQVQQLCDTCATFMKQTCTCHICDGHATTKSQTQCPSLTNINRVSSRAPDNPTHAQHMCNNKCDTCTQQTRTPTSIVQQNLCNAQHASTTTKHECA
jgi:hypothetical protein